MNYLQEFREKGCSRTKYKGNLTTMRNHCAGSGVGHYKEYVRKCVSGKIPMHDRCMPDSIRKKIDDKG